MTEQIRCCPECGEPVVFTFEFRGHERFCVACEWKGDVFSGVDKPATDERMERYAALHARYEEQSAERMGHAPPSERKEAPRPTCGGCGIEARGPMQGDKPAHWYSATREGLTSYACSRSCIPAKEMVMPW